MKRRVMKFGGTSLATPERIRHAVAHVKAAEASGISVAVVVSAMGAETDTLVRRAREMATSDDPREYDAIVAAGEQVSAGLFALALQEAGLAARSWLGWQIPIRTDGMHGSARITGLETKALEASMAAGEIPVVAGFQGVAPDGRLATLGRGGSDTTAVALAAALSADRCDIYTDVAGIFTADPGIVEDARRIAKISYEEMLEMASLGARVLQTRCVELAMTQRVRLCVRASFGDVPKSGDDASGTHVCDEDEIVEKPSVSAIAHSGEEARITLSGLSDEPGVAARVFGPLADAGINLDMIAQSATEDARRAKLTFTLPREDLKQACALLEKAQTAIGYETLTHDARVAKLSIIGIAMRTHAGIAQRMFQALADEGINIQAISTSEIKLSVLIAADEVERAVRKLHHVYGLAR